MKKNLFLCILLFLGFFSAVFAENFNRPSYDEHSNRQVTNICTLQANDTITKIVSGSLKFYDEGGQAADYTRGHSGAITFIPSDPNKVIKLVISNATDLAYADKMTIYNGASFIDETLISKKGDFRDVPATFLSTAPNGALTFDFYSKPSSSSYSYEGWEIDVIEYTPLPLSYGTTTISNQAPAQLFKNTQNNVFAQIAITVNGDAGEFVFNSIDISQAGSTTTAIDKVKLYFTGTDENYTSNSKIYLPTTHSNTFTLNKAIHKPGTYYFWVTVDVASTAVANDDISIELESITINSQLKTVPSTTCTASIQSGFHGNYTIGSSSNADYADFRAACFAMKDGIDGPVVFTVEAGTYNRIELPNILGTSPINTISFIGDKQTVLFEKGNTYPADKKGLIDVNGMDYVTIDGFSALNVSNNWQGAVLIHNTSHHVTLKNAHITVPTFNDYSHNMDGVITAKGENIIYHNNDFLTIENCTVQGGKYGLYIDGTGYVKLPKQKGTRLINNTISNFGYAGIYITKDHDFEISNNTINNNASTSSNSKCIDAVAMPGGVIANNRLTSNCSNYVSGIYLRSRSSAETTEPTHIFNNSIYFVQASGSSYGINFTDPMLYTEVVYNTISMNGSSASSACLFSEDNTDTKQLLIENNIFQNSATGYAIKLKSQGALTTETKYSHNVYQGILGQSSWDVSTWNMHSKDQSSQQKTVTFVADNILELNNNTGLISASPIVYVSQDINGVTRPTQPTPGAFEYQSNTDIAPNMLSNYPRFSNSTAHESTMTLKADANGTAYYLTSLQNATPPSIDMIKATGESIAFTKNVEKSVILNSLIAASTYKVYLVLASLQTAESNIIISDTFTTDRLPSSISDFENTRLQNNKLLSGTASFETCTLQDNGGLNDSKCALISSGSSASITNSSTGILLSGFYLWSDASVTLQAYNEKSNTEFTSKQIQATNQWEYISLKEMGNATKIVFTTTSNNVKIDNFSGQPLPLSLEMLDIVGNTQENIILNATRTGGVYPFAYEWRNSDLSLISTQESASFTDNASTQVYLTITDAWGTKISKRTDVRLNGNQVMGDFEDLYLSNDTAWAGAWNDANKQYQNLNDHFYTGSYQLSNYCIPGLKTWAFFAYGNETSTNFVYSDFIEHQFRNTVGGGYNGSENYGISYCFKGMGHTDLTIANNSQGDSISGMYITNTAYLYDCILNGDHMSTETDGTTGKGFATGDSVVLTAHGYVNNIETASTSIYLADYTNTDEIEHYILQDWKYFDLSKLGKVQFVRFTMESSKSNKQGMTTPAYFALDNIGADRPTLEVTTNSDSNTSEIDLSSLCPINGNGETHYTLLDSSTGTTAQINTNQLNITVPGKGNYTYLVKVDNKSNTLYYQITLAVSEGTDLESIKNQYSVIHNNSTLYVKPSYKSQYKVTLYNATGTCVFEVNNQQGETTISTNTLPHGVYMVQVVNKTFKQTTKITI